MLYRTLSYPVTLCRVVADVNLLQSLKGLVDHGLAESLEAIQRLTAESMHELQSVTERLHVGDERCRTAAGLLTCSRARAMQEEARRRDGIPEEEEEEEGSDDEESDDEPAEAEAAPVGASAVESSAAEVDEDDDVDVLVPAQAAQLDDDDGPKIEVLD